MNEHIGSRKVSEDLQSLGGGASKKSLANQCSGRWVRDLEKVVQKTGQSVHSIIGVESPKEGQ